MALPIPLLAAGGAALLYIFTRPESSYAQAPSDGSKPAKKEPAPPAKSWKEMPPALQEQVAAVLGELGVSPATGKLSGAPVSAAAIQAATQTAALCESQGFYEIAKQLRAYAEEAVRQVPTPPAAQEVVKAAPPGMSAAEAEALGRTITMERDPKVLRALRERLVALPPTPQRDYLVQMLDALVLQLSAAQSTTQTMQQIDQVIKSPGIAEVHQAVQPLPPAVIPVMTSPPAPPPAVAPVKPPVVVPAAAVPPAPKPPVSPPAGSASPLTHALLLPLTGTRVLKKGSKGEDVRAWQRILRLDGYTQTVKDDADYGDVTKAATKDWQSKRGLSADGEVGPKTRAKVGTPPMLDGRTDGGSAAPIPQQPPAPAAAGLVFAKVLDPTPNAKVLTPATATKAEASSLQSILTALGYGAIVGKVDGSWGAKTTTALKALQQHAKDRYRDSRPIVVDGQVGPQTRRIIVARTAELRGVVIGARRRMRRAA